jgi:hypothetical protein
MVLVGGIVGRWVWVCILGVSDGFEERSLLLRFVWVGWMDVERGC